MVAIASSGIHFRNPGEFLPYTAAVASLSIYDSTDTAQASSTVAFFTEMARRGFQDTTNWTADTYKTLLNVASGKGFLGNLVGCTAGGAETTTFRITNDGVVTVIAVTGLASGERACLLPRVPTNVDFTTANVFATGGAEALDTDKATFIATRASSFVQPWRVLMDVPLLKFNNSLLVEAKHSVDITNSTATAYSGGMYRLLLA